MVVTTLLARGEVRGASTGGRVLWPEGRAPHAAASLLSRRLGSIRPRLPTAKESGPRGPPCAQEGEHRDTGAFITGVPFGSPDSHLSLSLHRQSSSHRGGREDPVLFLHPTQSPRGSEDAPAPFRSAVYPLGSTPRKAQRKRCLFLSFQHTHSAQKERGEVPLQGHAAQEDT